MRVGFAITRKIDEVGREGGGIYAKGVILRRLMEVIGISKAWVGGVGALWWLGVVGVCFSFWLNMGTRSPHLEKFEKSGKCESRRPRLNSPVVRSDTRLVGSPATHSGIV